MTKKIEDPAEEFNPTEAQILASLIKRSGSMSMSTASIQRSHRFPLHTFTQIENMARMADVSVSTIINQLLASGIEAVQLNLSEDEIREICSMSREQVERPTKMLREPMNTKNTKAKKQ